MQGPDAVNSVLEYIDKHISDEIQATELAEMVGYSFYHFCHLFKSCANIPVGMYIRKRRMELAAGELLRGDSVTEVAARYGFDTHSGFTRAFKKRYGVSPTGYKALKGGFLEMTHEIRKMEGFSAVGYRLAPPEGDFEVLDSAAYWLGKDFASVSKEDYAKLNTPNQDEVGAWMHPDSVSGAFWYFFGPIVNDKSFVPAGMEAMDIPAAEYAVFTVPAADSAEGLNANIRSTMKYIFSEWLDSEGYVLDEGKIVYEYYMGEGTFIYVPVVRK